MSAIDFRLRPPTGAFLKLVLYADAARRDRITRQHGFEPAPSALARSMPLLLQEMDAAGVQTGVLMARRSPKLGTVSNDDVQRIVDAHPTRFCAFAVADERLGRHAADGVAGLIARGFRGINLEPGADLRAMTVNDPALHPLYEACEAAQVPIVVMAGGSAGPDLSYTDPVHLDRVAAAFPRLPIVVSHGGWPWIHAMLHIAFRRENVYLSPDQYLARMAGMREMVQAMNGFLKERFLYGSSYPFLPVDRCLEWFRQLPISPEALPFLLQRNAQRVLSMAQAWSGTTRPTL